MGVILHSFIASQLIVTININFWKQTSINVIMVSVDIENDKILCKQDLVVVFGPLSWNIPE